MSEQQAFGHCRYALASRDGAAARSSVASRSDIRSTSLSVRTAPFFKRIDQQDGLPTGSLFGGARSCIFISLQAVPHHYRLACSHTRVVQRWTSRKSFLGSDGEHLQAQPLEEAIVASPHVCIIRC